MQQAERYAQQHGRSLAALVEDYLRQVVQEPAQPLAPAVQELYGILSLPADFDYKTQSATSQPVDAPFTKCKSPLAPC